MTETEKIKFHAEKCPICYGTGYVGTLDLNTKRFCHGCHGRGWVEVRNE